MRDEIKTLYGGIWACCYTLYMCVTGGTDWGDATISLTAMGSANQLLMSFYIFFVNIAVMNVITGIFVQGAIDTALTDQEELIQDQLIRRDSELQQLNAIFKESDLDGSGTVTRQEFVQHCTDKRVRALLRALGLDVDMANSLFKLLDVTDSGEIDIQELVVASMRLKGQATAMDVAVLM